MWIGKINSLQKLSFNVIVKEFERFSFAFASSEDKNLQRLFEFLQRRYSNELAAELHLNDNLTEKYCNLLLINKHLTFLYDGWLRNTRYLTSTRQILRCLPNLTSISYSTCGNELMKNLADFCPKIAEIDIRYSNVTDYGLQYLCRRKNGRLPCPELKSIVFRGALVTDRGVENLMRNVPSLKWVDYLSLPKLLRRIHAKNFYRIGRKHYCNLLEINLLEFDYLPYFTEILESCFSVCPKLESFACNIPNREMLNYFTDSHLKQLGLKFLTDDSDINIDEFLKVHGCNLAFLSISNCTLSLSVLAVHCPGLVELQVHFVDFIDADAHLLPSFSSLTTCTFHEMVASAEKTVSSLLSCTANLEALVFIGGELSRKMASQILIWCKRPSSKVVDFQYLELQLEFLTEILLSCRSLEQMSLIYCGFDVKDPREIFLGLKRITSNKPEIYLHDCSE